MKRDRRAALRALVKAALAGDMNAAAVLADAAIEAGARIAGENLNLALQGRAYDSGTTTWQVPAGGVRRVWDRGDRLTDPMMIDNVRHNAIKAIAERFFPRRKPVCLPNKRKLLRLVEENSGAVGVEARRLAQRLWQAMTKVCVEPNVVWSWSTFDAAMRTANDVLRGHGVERVNAGDSVFYYINMGDPYVETLLFENHVRRFRIASWGDIVEGSVENRLYQRTWDVRRRQRRR